MDYNGYPYAGGYQQQWQPVPPQQWQQQDQQFQQQRFAAQPQVRPQAGLIGRVVANEGEILPSDVSSDGSWSWYPMASGAYVVGRRMDKDLNVTHVRFVPEERQQPQPTQADRIEEKLNRLLGMMDGKGAEDAGSEQDVR